MALCDDCNGIDFGAVGLRTPGSPGYNFFAKDDVALQSVLDKAQTCFFCQKISDIFFQWAQLAYGGTDRLDLEKARVGVSAYRLKSLETDLMDPDSSLAYLFRISVDYTIRNPDYDEWIGPTVQFQKCATQNNHVSALFDEGNGTVWPPQQEPYIGRIRPLVSDTRLFKKWKEYCLSAHQGKCGTSYGIEKPPKLRLIDVNQKCVVEIEHDVTWVALSYLWGKARMLTLTRDSLNKFRQPGFLSKDIVPRTIYDAMTLTVALSERFLWVDSICIIQDDAADKLEYIPRMDSIYGRASLTIIDAAGSDAHGGLPGIQPASRFQEQTPFQIKGVTLVQTLDPVSIHGPSYMSESKWNARGWTFQEGILSTRALVFTTEQVYWQCEEATWCEDGFWECPDSPTIYRHGLNDDFHHIWEPGMESIERKYRQLVETYSQRSLTYESDGLDAFAGILAAFERAAGLQFLWGLPVIYLGVALTWPAKGDKLGVRRRTAMCSLKQRSGEIILCPFPSWSWVGWVGMIHFDEVFGLLTSEHAGIVFYKIRHDGTPEVIPQNSNFRQKYEESQFADRKLKPSNPDWRDDSRTTIVPSDIPKAVFSRSLCPVVLCFWTSTAVLEVEYEHNGSHELRGADPKLSHNGVEIKVLWDQVPQRPAEGKSQNARFIVVGRDSLDGLRSGKQLTAIVADLRDDEGISYRKGMASIYEADWNALYNKVWEKIFLA